MALSRSDIFVCSGIYLLLLISHGYIFGYNDQVDFMPYALSLQDSALFQNDFYIQCIRGHWNERWLLAHSISLIPKGYWPITFIGLHVLCSMLLIMGLYRFSNYYLKNQWYAALTVILSTITFYHINLGGNELYYNMVCGSLIAKALGIWCLWLAYRSSWMAAAALGVAATYLHPIAGAQVLFLSFFLSNKKNLLKQIIFSGILIAPYIISLVSHLGQSVDADFFSDLMYLRNAHHFYPLAFGIKNYLILIPLFSIGTYLLYKMDEKMGLFGIVIISGAICYSILLYIYPKWAIMSQWFKSTIWLKFFCLVAIIHFIQLHIDYRKRMIIFSTLCLLTCMKVFRHFIHTQNIQNEISFAKNIKATTDPSDLFVVPADYTAFKYYAERPTFIDWKAIPHNADCLKEWYRRIQLVYNLSIKNNGNLETIYSMSNIALQNMIDSKKDILKSEGVKYIVFKENGSYKLITL